MKKFMKAIAFVTVMCMLLSTVAFAHQVPATAKDKTFTVTVENAGSEQVALMVVTKDAADFSDPLYIDQKGAIDGTAEFTAKIARDVEAVDVYVGYASNVLDENGKAPKVGTVTLKEAITEVTISNVETEIVRADGKQQIGAGVAIKFDVEAPADVYATDMIWAIRYLVDGVEKVKYTDSMDVSGYGIGTLMKGSVELGLAFLNGFTVGGEEKIKEYEIRAVDAIFMFTNEDVEFTNPADAANEAE